MKVRIVLTDGNELRGDVPLPGFSVDSPSAPAAAVGEAIARYMVPAIAGAMEPHLPPPTPARKEIKRDERGAIVGMVEHPAKATPAARALRLAEQLVPTVAATYTAAYAAAARAERAKRTPQ